MVLNTSSLSPEQFKERIKNDDFLEYEEVYKDRFYGTLKEQVEHQSAAGQNVVFDVDVKERGCNIKRFYGERALSFFIQPPSLDELRRRLVGRQTDSAEAIENRLAASYESLLLLTSSIRLSSMMTSTKLNKRFTR